MKLFPKFSMLHSPLLSTRPVADEEPLEHTLRPESFSSYVGQASIKESLSIAIQAAKQRQATVDHILLYGPPGLGKTSLAHLIAREMNSSIRISSGPVLGKAGDLAAILTNLQTGDILFIDEIHRLQRNVEEILYPAMEEHKLDLMIGKGPSARNLRLDLNPFTLVGATTRAGSLSQPLRDRFGLIHRLEYYEENELVDILTRSSQVLKLDITSAALEHIASRSRKTPRVANRLLRRVRDFAQVKKISPVEAKDAQAALDQLHIDHLGLDKLDRLFLSTLHSQFDDGPVGLQTIAASLGEEVETIEDVIEPYLLQIGFIARTPRGRVLSDQGKAHLGIWSSKE